MPTRIILTYDLHGSNKSKDEFNKYLIGDKWSVNIMRNGVYDRLPNTTMVSGKSDADAIASFQAARNAASRHDASFKVTHWSMGAYIEAFGGLDPEEELDLRDLFKDIGVPR